MAALLSASFTTSVQSGGKNEVTVRLALGCACERQGQNSFERAVARHLQSQPASGVPGQCELQGLALTASTTSRSTGRPGSFRRWMRSTSEPLNGLGIPCDYALRQRGCRCLQPLVQSGGRRLVQMLAVDRPSCGPNGRGGDAAIWWAQPLQSLIQKILESHHAGLGLHSPRGGCACVGGDGQIVRGGSAAVHGSSGVARTWHTIHEDGVSGLFLEWRRLHGTGSMWRILACPGRLVPARQRLQIVTELDTLFSVRERRQLPRLSGLSVVKTFKLIVLCLHARILWKHEGKAQPLWSVCCLGAAESQTSALFLGYRSESQTCSGIVLLTFNFALEYTKLDEITSLHGISFLGAFRNGDGGGSVALRPHLPEADRASSRENFGPGHGQKTAISS